MNRFPRAATASLLNTSFAFGSKTIRSALNSWFLSAERIVFEPNAKLVFSKDAVAARGNLFILAREITSLDQEHPGQISWEKPSAPGAPGQPGSAAAGASNNQSEGAPGGRGADGQPGSTGERGHDAPSLTVITLA